MSISSRAFFIRPNKTSLKMGIVGMPNVGKSSLFNLLCKQSVPAENYPFCTIEPNEARCAVPNDRFDFLCRTWKPQGSRSSSLQIMDIAGLIRGASEGVGLGNSFLSHIQAVDGIYHVVRAFEDSKIAHVDGTVDPVRDLETIQSELCKKDLELINRACATGRITRDRKIKETLTKAQDYLAKKIPLLRVEWTVEEANCFLDNTPGLLTTKAASYLLNVSKRDYLAGSTERWTRPVLQWIGEKGISGPVIPVSVELEQELDSYQNDPELLTLLQEEMKDLRSSSPEASETSETLFSALPNVIHSGFYETLNLISFFTVGEKEVRCWTIPAGTRAPQAAGQIHSDFIKGFQKAQVVSYDDFVKFWEASNRTVKFNLEGDPDLGPARIEGKSYEVKDGDIVVFRIQNRQ